MSTLLPRPPRSGDQFEITKWFDHLFRVINPPSWIDIDFPIVIRTTGPNQPVLTPLQGNISLPLWMVNDFNVCETQELIHSWREDTEVNWHAHIITGGTDTNDRFVRFEVEYTWVNVGGQLAPNVIAHSGDFRIPANTPAKTMLVVPIHQWVPTGGRVASHVMVRLRRIAATGTAPTANVYCGMLQLHIQQDSLGSKELWKK